MTPTAYILIGPSGSGKSTWTTRSLPPGTVVCSADDHFMQDNGVYRFDPSQLKQAHGECLRKYLNAARNAEHMCVDNTNTTIAEVAPYIAVAQAYAYDIRAIFFDTPWQLCAKQNTKGVDSGLIIRMAYQAVDMIKNWPGFWPRIEVVSAKIEVI